MAGARHNRRVDRTEFQEGYYKNNRRQLFFPEADVGTWSDQAAADPDPFADEKERAAAKKKKKPPHG